MARVPPQIAVLDYGSGNLRSAVRALERAGATVELTGSVDRAAQADGLVVPGVGAFAACMRGLRAVGGDRLILDQVASERALLAICVGFQVLFTRGVEHGETTDGCAIFDGEVNELQSTRLPHMGWNTVTADPASRYFAEPDERFYFVHSYGVHPPLGPSVRPLVTTVCHGGDTVIAAVESGSVLATQFHPEKSGAAGARLLAQWVQSVSR